MPVQAKAPAVKAKGATSARRYSVAATTKRSKPTIKSNGFTARKPTTNKSASRRSQTSVSPVRPVNKSGDRNSNSATRRKPNKLTVTDTGAALLSRYPLPNEIATWNIWDAKKPKLFDGEPLVDANAWTKFDTVTFAIEAFFFTLLGFVLGEIFK